MMEMEDLLPIACIRRVTTASSRKRALDLAAEMLAREHADLSISARALFNALMERELLGSTGLGDGVAIPHCRIQCPRLLGALISLSQPVDFDAMDGKPVDLLFVLVAPKGEATAHLRVLAHLAAVFGDEQERSRLRAAGSEEQLAERFFQALHQHDPASASGEG